MHKKTYSLLDILRAVVKALTIVGSDSSLLTEIPDFNSVGGKHLDEKGVERKVNTIITMPLFNIIDQHACVLRLGIHM